MPIQRAATYLRLIKCPASTCVQCSRFPHVMHVTMPLLSASRSRTNQLKHLSSLLVKIALSLRLRLAFLFALLFVLLRGCCILFVIRIRYERPV
jgi:hypothetical protein